MRQFGILIVMLVALSATSCSRNQGADVSSEPLTFETWKILPAQQKYDVSTLERLKLGEPKLQEDREWERFLYTVIAPGKKKELAPGS